MLLKAQDNVGIGTAAPHPSALLEISDSSRGVLIPRTDTLAVLDYVNSLTPNPGIANGLMIFDVNLNTYLFYDDVAGNWKRLTSLVGPTGPKGPQGPRGPIGPQGTNTDWRDSTANPVFDPIRDTCGDWFINTETEQVWRYWCDSTGNKNQWRDTNYFDFYIGELMAPDERIEVFNQQTSTALTETMASSTDIVVMKAIPGLSMSLTLQNDEIAYIIWAAHGTATRAFPGGDLAYAQYDAFVGGIGPGSFYSDVNNIETQVTMGPSGPPPPGQPLQALSDRPGWYISGNVTVAAPLSAAPICRCGHPTAQLPCNCPNGGGFSMTVVAGNRYSGSATTNIVILADETTKEAVGHLNVMAIIRRNPSTWDWKK
ncbi:MAG: collagen-like protein [Vicingaceae bacterium]